MKTTTTVLIKTMRGDILQFLYGIAPSKAKESSITKAYSEYYPYKDLLRAIHYLREAGYIHLEEIPNPSTDNLESFYVISSEGMCIVERTKTDVGITIATEDD